MNYSFEFNSSAMGRIQPFEYSYATTNEYAFTYSRDIFSDLSKFNAPIFVMRKRRGIFSYDKIYNAVLEALKLKKTSVQYVDMILNKKDPSKKEKSKEVFFSYCFTPLFLFFIQIER